MPDSPHVILIFGDQWRTQAFGYAGNSCVQTPHIDRLASQSINATHAVSGCSVCCPARASLLTGQYPLTHGVFVNDVHLSDRAVSLAQAFKSAGYDTAYVGKWHVNANGRSNYIPPENRQGFDYWKVLECTHNYNNSFYYANDSDEKLTWEGYDAIAQTRDVQDYIQNHDSENPFLLVLSWGPPHAPYETAPENTARCIVPRMCLCARMCRQNPKRMPENGLRVITPTARRWTIVWAICSRHWTIRV